MDQDGRSAPPTGGIQDQSVPSSACGDAPTIAEGAAAPDVQAGAEKALEGARSGAREATSRYPLLAKIAAIVSPSKASADACVAPPTCVLDASLSAEQCHGELTACREELLAAREQIAAAETAHAAFRTELDAWSTELEHVKEIAMKGLAAKQRELNKTKADLDEARAAPRLLEDCMNDLQLMRQALEAEQAARAGAEEACHRHKEEAEALRKKLQSCASVVKPKNAKREWPQAASSKFPLKEDGGDSTHNTRASAGQSPRCRSQPPTPRIAMQASGQFTPNVVGAVKRGAWGSPTDVTNGVLFGPFGPAIIAGDSSGNLYRLP